MDVAVLSLGLLFLLVSAVCAAFILAHAFRQSVGTGVMVLFIPCYVLYYAFANFEHRHKGLILAGFLGGGGLGVVLMVMATSGLSLPQRGLEGP